MAKLERTITVPLRRKAVVCQRYKRTPRAMKALKEFVSRHMKSDDVRVGPALNEAIWARGMRSPPPRVKVNAVRDEEGVCRVELFGAPAFEAPKSEEDKKAEKKAAPKKEAKSEDKPADKKVKVQEVKKTETKQAEDKKSEAKPSEKKE